TCAYYNLLSRSVAHASAIDGAFSSSGPSIYWQGPVEASTCPRHSSASLLLIFVMMALAGSPGFRSTRQSTTFGLSGSETPDSCASAPGIGGQPSLVVHGCKQRLMQVPNAQFVTHV